MNEDGRWITTKSGNRVFIKNKDVNNYMNERIRDNVLRINAKDEIRTIEDYSLTSDDAKVKQLIDKKTKQVMSELHYEKNNGETKITMIRTYEQFRGKGYATKLLKDLQREVGNQDIDFDYLTPDGKELINKVGTITEKKVGPFGREYYKGRIKE